MIARGQMRQRGRALVALTLFVGVAGGLSMALIAGARRSSSVVDRYAATARTYDLSIYIPDDTTAAAWPQDRLLAIPGVVRADPAAYMALTAQPRAGGVAQGVNANVQDWTALDPTTRVLEGRIPDGTDPTEILVNRGFVDQFGYGVGDTVTMRTFGLDQADDVSQGVYEPHGPEYRFRITGIVRPASDLVTGEARALGSTSYGATNAVLVSNAFYEQHATEFLGFGLGYNISLRDGAAGTQAFTDALAARTPAGQDPPQHIPPLTQRDTGPVDSPVQLETTALLALGTGLGVAGAIATVLIVRAEQRAHDDDIPTLRSLGCSIPQIAGAAVLRALPAAVGGTLVAVDFALMLSARFPIGIGREIELDPGVQANLAVLGLGSLAILGLVLGSAFAFGRPRRDRDGAPTRPRTFAGWLGRTGAPTDLTIAAHLSFDRLRGARTGRGVPSRSAIAGGATLLAVLVAVGVYVGGADRLYTSRSAHGWVWDAAIGNTNFPLDPATAAKLAADPRITAQTGAADGQAKVNGSAAEFVAFDPSGTVSPAVVSGRVPRTDHEIALGAGTARRLGVHVGDSVTFSVKDGEYDTTGEPTTPQQMTVVGTALAPVFGDRELDQVGLVTFGGIAAAGGGAQPQLVLAKLRDGPTAKALGAIDRDYTEEIATDLVGGRIVNLHRVRAVPLLGILAAALMGIFVLVYVLAVSVRARTREHAVLRALGLPVRRLRHVLAWQGGILAVGILIIGIPAGLVLGTALWRRVADGIGVRADVALSPWLLCIVPLVLLVALGASLVPARRAAREQITELLRAE